MSDKNARIQKAAQAFLRATAKIPLPTHGKVADFLSDRQPKMGVNITMRGIAEMIGMLQDSAMEHSNKELLERLRDLCEKKARDAAGNEKEDPYNAMGAIFNVAYPGDDGLGAVQMQELQAAMRHNGRPIFDEMMRVINDIAINKKLEIDGGIDDMIDDPDRKPEPEGPATGWRASLKDDDRPAIDNRSIEKSAGQFDEHQPPVNDKDIKRSAEAGNEFRITDEHRSEYERGEGMGGLDHLRELRDEESELNQYASLCRQLQKAYDETLGTCLDLKGVAPGGKR